MALPTAQLGSMGGLSVPTHIPTVVVPRQQNPWEAALMMMLANAGGQALGQGVTNAMSSDAATEFGETPRTFMQRALRGPAVSAQEAAQRRGFQQQTKLETIRETGANTRAEKDREARAFSDELAHQGRLASLSQQGDISGREMQLRNEIAKLGQMSEEARMLEAGNRDILHSNDAAQTRLLQDSRERPKRLMETEKLKQDVEAARLSNEVMRSRLPTAGQGKTGPTDAQKKFAEQAAMRKAQDEKMGQRLSDTSRYPTGEQLGVGVSPTNQQIYEDNPLRQALAKFLYGVFQQSDAEKLLNR